MIIVDETEPIGELDPPFEPRHVDIRFNEEVRDHFDMKKEIGRGRFGTVYLCNCLKTGVKFAAKFINTKRKNERRNVEREVEIMKILHEKKPHPKLIQLYDAFDMKSEMCLIVEIVDGGELFERVINDDFVLSEKACVVIIKQICQAVEYIHSKNILHLDMKPENILCTSVTGNRIKICDFGLARKYDPRKKLQVLFGTPEFVAPEVVNFEPISFGTDMWSVGVICYVLLSGLSPFMGHNFVETMTNVTKNQYDFDDEAFDDVSDQAINFIESLLKLDKNERLTSTQCLRHDWIRKPLPPIKRQRRRRSTTVSSASSSSSDSDFEEDIISRLVGVVGFKNPKKEVVVDDADDDVFVPPVRAEVDEGKKRKISEDVLEKENKGIEKKRKDDDGEIRHETDAVEKMSASSLFSDSLAEEKLALRENLVPDLPKFSAPQEKDEKKYASFIAEEEGKINKTSKIQERLETPLNNFRKSPVNLEKKDENFTSKTTSLEKILDENINIIKKSPVVLDNKDEFLNNKMSGMQERLGKPVDILRKSPVMLEKKEINLNNKSELKKDISVNSKNIIRKSPVLQHREDKHLEITSSPLILEKTEKHTQKNVVSKIQEKPAIIYKTPITIAVVKEIQENGFSNNKSSAVKLTEKAPFVNKKILDEDCFVTDNSTLICKKSEKPQMDENKIIQPQPKLNHLHIIDNSSTQKDYLEKTCRSNKAPTVFQKEEKPSLVNDRGKRDVINSLHTTPNKTLIKTTATEEKIFPKATPVTSPQIRLEPLFGMKKKDPLLFRKEKTNTRKRNEDTSRTQKPEKPRTPEPLIKFPIVISYADFFKPVETKQDAPAVHIAETSESTKHTAEKSNDAESTAGHKTNLTCESQTLESDTIKNNRILSQEKIEKGSSELGARVRNIPISKEPQNKEESKISQFGARRRNVDVPIHIEGHSQVKKIEKSILNDGKEGTQNAAQGRIIPIIFEDNDVEKQPICKKETLVQFDKSEESKPRQRKREIPITLDTNNEKPKTERRREIDVYNNKTSDNVAFQSNTQVYDKDSKTAVNSKKKEDEPKSNAKRDLSSDEIELERTKKQLKEFVERWNSHPDSPYVIGTPVLPEDIEKPNKLGRTPSCTSLASVAVAAPSVHEAEELSDVEMFDIDAKEEDFAHYIIDQPNVIPVNDPLLIAKELRQKLKELEENENITSGNYKSTAQKPKGNSQSTDVSAVRVRNRGLDDVPQRPEVTALQRDGPRVRRRPSAVTDTDPERKSRMNSSSSSKMPPGRDVPLHSTSSPTEIAKKVEEITISDCREGSPVKRSRTSGRHRPTRDVLTQPNKDGVVSFPIGYEPTKESGKKSRSSTPTRRSRKISREEKKTSRAPSRAHSRESNHSTSGKSHRRPSRDVPITSAQTERLKTLNISGCEVIDALEQDQLWPDIRVVPQNEDVDLDVDDDSSESAPVEPVTFKLELPVHKADQLNNNLTQISKLNDSKSNQYSKHTKQIDPQEKEILQFSVSESSSAAILKSSVTPNASMSSATSLADKLMAKASNTSDQTNTQNRILLTKSNSMNRLEKDTRINPDHNDPAYVTENKLVAWILDIGAPQKRLPLSGSTTDLVSHFEGRDASLNTAETTNKEKLTRTRDRSPMPADRNRDKSAAMPPRPPFGCPLTREKSATNLNSSDASEIIQTPWGTLKRSSSRNSINRSPSKTSLNTSPTSSTLFRTISSDVPLIKLDEEMDVSFHSNKAVSSSNKYSLSSGESIPSQPNSRSPSPRSFRPYNTKSFTSKNLNVTGSTSSDRGSNFFMKPSKSVASVNTEVAKSPSPPVNRSPSSVSCKFIPIQNGKNGDQSMDTKHEANLSLFDKKVSKQTSLEVLDHTNKRDSVASKTAEKVSSDYKSNTLPRPRQASKESSPGSNRSSSKPPSGDSKRNSMEIALGERRSSRSSPGAAFPPKKQFSFLLFSAHDRISQFENKEDKPSTRTQRPISRSKTTTTFKDENTYSSVDSELDSSSRLSNKSHRDENQNSMRPSVVSTKA